MFPLTLVQLRDGGIPGVNGSRSTCSATDFVLMHDPARGVVHILPLKPTATGQQPTPMAVPMDKVERLVYEDPKLLEVLAKKKAG